MEGSFGGNIGPVKPLRIVCSLQRRFRAETAKRKVSRAVWFLSRIVPFVSFDPTRQGSCQGFNWMRSRPLTKLCAMPSPSSPDEAIGIMWGRGNTRVRGPHESVSTARPTGCFSLTFGGGSSRELGDTNAQQSTGRAFRFALLDAANAELEASMSSIPCATIQRPRAEARARRAFRSRVWKLDSQLQQTGKQEDIDAEL